MFYSGILNPLPPHHTPDAGGMGQRIPVRSRATQTVNWPSSVKVTGLAQKLGQLEAVSRDLQSKYWANLNILGQPCSFPALATSDVLTDTYNHSCY